MATPGRLNDFVKRGHVSFASVQFFVLDEADRMLDMGFLPCVEQMMGDSSMVATVSNNNCYNTNFYINIYSCISFVWNIVLCKYVKTIIAF